MMHKLSTIFTKKGIECCNKVNITYFSIGYLIEPVDFSKGLDKEHFVFYS